MTATTADDMAGTPAPELGITLDRHHLAVLELLAGGWLDPLRSFMTRAEAQEWSRNVGQPVPALSLDLPSAVGEALVGHTVALRDAEGVALAAMEVQEAVPVDDHVVTLPSSKMVSLHGPLTVHQPPIHYDHADLRLTLAQAREVAGTDAVVVPAGHPLTTAGAAHVQALAAEGQRPIVLLSLVGEVPPDDARAHTLVRAHMMTSARWRRDGATRVVHLILPVATPTDTAGHALLARVLTGTFAHAVVARQTAELLDGTDTTPHAWPDDLHGGAIRPEPLAMLEEDVADLVARRQATTPSAGLTLFFTGLSGSGKSTVANAVMARLHAETDRRITLLDGDLVRQHLSSELSFSREHRDLNITRIGFVAAEVTKHGGVAICAPIAPYAATRAEVRRMVEAHGTFVLVHVATPLDVCEARDRKGLYAKARAGVIGSFTGISDPYEEPMDAELVLDTSTGSVADAAEGVMALLRSTGAIPQIPSAGTGSVG